MNSKLKLHAPHVIVPIKPLTVDCKNCKGREFVIKIFPQGGGGNMCDTVC